MTHFGGYVLHCHYTGKIFDGLVEGVFVTGTQLYIFSLK